MIWGRNDVDWEWINERIHKIRYDCDNNVTIEETCTCILHPMNSSSYDCNANITVCWLQHVVHVIQNKANETHIPMNMIVLVDSRAILMNTDKKRIQINTSGWYQSELKPAVKPNSSSWFLVYTWHLDIILFTRSFIFTRTESARTCSLFPPTDCSRKHSLMEPLYILDTFWDKTRNRCK